MFLMDVFGVVECARFDPVHHVEGILGRVDDGDFTVACWEPGQSSPYHCHPQAVEAYFCFQGACTMRAEAIKPVEVVPGTLVVFRRGELHDIVNGAGRTLLLRVRYGGDPAARTLAWESNPQWRPLPADSDYFGLF